MKCPSENTEHAELLVAWCAGRLESETAAGIEQHLAGCPACRDLVRAQRAVWQAMGGWDAPPVSAGFDARLYRRIQERPWWDLALRPARWALVRHPLPAALAACLMIAASLVVQRPAALPVAPVPQSAQLDSVSADQVERALDEMEMLREFNPLAHQDAGEPKM